MSVDRDDNDWDASWQRVMADQRPEPVDPDSTRSDVETKSDEDANDLQEAVKTAMAVNCETKNEYIKTGGFSPSQWALAKQPRGVGRLLGLLGAHKPHVRFREHRGALSCAGSRRNGGGASQCGRHQL